MDQEHKQTHFGFKQVTSEKKQGLVNQVFSSVANKYDLMNDLMSFGIHHFWKSSFVDYIKNLDSKILDVAGGTGDISFKIIEKARKIGAEPQITIADINVEILKVGKDKAIDKNIINNIKFTEANAEDLPFDDNSFDYYTVAFGIRNMTNLDKVISEAYRVLKPGGKFLCLEFSQVKPIFVRKIYDLYSFNIIPQIGHFVAGDKDSYEYLVESIRKFPRQEKFAELINAAGFKNVKYKNLTFGVCAIHSAEKI